MATPTQSLAPDQQPEQFEAIKAARLNQTGQDNSRSIEEQLNQTLKKFDWNTRRNRIARYFVGFQNELFWRGIQLFTLDPDLGTAKIWDEEDQDLYSPINLTKWAVEMNSAEYTKSKPKLTAHSNIGDSDVEVQQALSEIEYLADCLYFDLWLSKPELEQREAHRVQFRGGIVGHTYFDPMGGPKVKVPKYQPQIQQIPGKLACPDCGAYGDVPPAGQGEVATGAVTPMAAPASLPGGTGGTSLTPPRMSMDDVPDDEATEVPGAPDEPEGQEAQQQMAPATCPQCGSPNAQVSPSTAVPTLAIAGYDELPQGEVRYDDYDLLQVSLSDRAKKIKETPWVRIDEVRYKTEIQAKYPHIGEIKDYSCSETVGKYSGLHYLRQLEIAIGNSGELDQSDGYTLGRGLQITDELTCLHTLVFLDHHVYCNMKAPRPWQIPGREDVIPADVKLGDVFPAGLLMWMVNEQAVAMENVDKNTRLTEYKYQPGASGFHSAGCDDIISINKAYNEENSIQIAWALMAAYGITLADEKIKGLKNTPDHICVVEDRQPNERLQDMYYHTENSGPTSEMEMMKQSHKGDIQLVSGARNPNNTGMPGEGMRTATGVQYQSATSDSFAAMRLELRAWQRAEAMAQACNLWRENALRPQWFSAYGETRGRWISPLNLPGDISFRVEEDSHQPRTNDDQRADLQLGLSLGWESGQLSETANEHLRKILRLPTSPSDYDLWEAKIQKRFEAAKKIVEMLVQAGKDQDPAALEFVMQPMMPKQLDNPGMFLRFLQERYLSDEYDNFPPILQAAIDQWSMVYTMDMAQKVAQAQAMQPEPSEAEGGKDNPKSKGKGATANGKNK